MVVLLVHGKPELRLEQIGRVGQQAGVEGEVHGVLRPGHGLPLDGGQGLRQVVADLKDVALCLIFVADGVAVGGVGVTVRAFAPVGQQAEHLVGGQAVVGVKEHVEGTLGGFPVLAVGNGDLLSQGFVQIVHALPIALILAGAEVLRAVGGGNVNLCDFRLCRVLGGDQEAVFQGQGDELRRSDDVLGVGNVDLAHDHHVGVH